MPQSFLRRVGIAPAPSRFLDAPAPPSHHFHEKLSGAGLRALAEKRIPVTSLDVSAAIGDSGWVTDAGLRWVAQFGRLTHLNLSNCRKITDAGVKAIGGKCPHLVSLDISRCNRLTTASIRHVLSNCPELTQLNVKRCFSTFRQAMQLRPHLSSHCKLML